MSLFFNPLSNFLAKKQSSSDFMASVTIRSDFRAQKEENCHCFQLFPFQLPWSDESERGEWKSWLKALHSENEDHGICSHHFMGNRWGNSVRLYFFGLQITADGDCSHEIRRHLPLRRKVMTNLDSIFKSRDITLPTKVHLIKTMIFPVVMYGCESWTINKAEHRRIDTFELWCWRRLLRVPWVARRSNRQS